MDLGAIFGSSQEEVDSKSKSVALTASRMLTKHFHSLYRYKYNLVLPFLVSIFYLNTAGNKKPQVIRLYFLQYNTVYMSHNISKCTFGHVYPAKIQINLYIHAWSESSPGTFWTANDAKFLHAENKDWSNCADAQAGLILQKVHFLMLQLIYSFTVNLLKFWTPKFLTKCHMQTVEAHIRLLLRSSLIRVFTVGHSTKHFKRQMHKKQNLAKKVRNNVFEILGHLPNYKCSIWNILYHYQAITPDKWGI